MGIFTSSTQAVPDINQVPRHVAIIMDGNGRWAQKRFLPRVAGHKKGLDAVRDTVKACVELGVEYLTLFAFSNENWRRPADEVSFLMGLFLAALEREVTKLHGNAIRLRVVGRRDNFDPKIVRLIEESEAKTAGNTRLTLTICADYGGRWDVIQATNRMLADKPELVSGFEEADLTPYLSLAYAPEPDLFIRTGGETRISNFMLWQLAYTELYFTEGLWPDFGRPELEAAILSYQQRERRFGRTSAQVVEASKPC